MKAIRFDSRWWLVGVGLALMATGSAGEAQESAAIPALETTEVFRVSRVGQPGAAESRELLMALYESVAGEYDRKVEADRAANPAQFKGDRVRILRDLREKDAGGGSLFLVAYNGGPAVISVTGEGGQALNPGELSPALVIGEAEAQPHPVEITRTVMVKGPAAAEPQLETVDEDSGGMVTFFGIPIPGTGTSGGESTAKAAPKEPTPGKTVTRRQEITETKPMPKYPAQVSTERIDGAPEKMTTERFVALLKNGEVYTATRSEQRRCQACRGFLRVATDRPVGFRDPDGKMPCPSCRAVGKIDWDVTYKIAW